MSQGTKDVILGVSPALFGLLGTFVGAWIAGRSAVGERRAKEDNEARKTLADLAEPAIVLGRWYVFGKGVEPSVETVRALRTGVPTARAALLTAGFPGFPFKASSDALAYFESLADVVNDHLNRPADEECKVAVLQAQEALEKLSALLDKSRRYRRSNWARRSMYFMTRGSDLQKGDTRGPHSSASSPTCGWASPSARTSSFTGRSPPARASRICRRRGSATALNASAVVAARATQQSYPYMGIC
jgi:hypothetical protein